MATLGESSSEMNDANPPAISQPSPVHPPEYQKIATTMVENAANWIDDALRQALVYQKTITETLDSTIDASKARLSQIRDTSVAHTSQTIDSLRDIASEYNVYEHMVFGKIKDGVNVAASHPVISGTLAFGIGIFALKSLKLITRSSSKEATISARFNIEAMVNLTLFPDRMCSLWNCRREVAHTFYCVNNNCEQQAANNITCQRPINLRNLYTHGELERLFLPKILFHLIHQVGNTGIPDLTGNLQILSQHPNDQPQRFATNLSPREDFSIWIFLACFAPHTQIWTGGNQIVDGNYVRKVFRPRVMQPNGAVWILHRYALVNNPATAFYTLQYKKPVLRHPLEQIQYMYADDDGNNGPDDSDDLDDDQDDEVVSCRRKRLKITHGPARPETAIWSNEKPDLKGTGRVMLNPLTSLSTGIHKTDSFQHYSEMDDDASLERAVESLVLALKKYEKKLKCAAEKKFSEIIASTFEDIHLELENVKNNVFSEEDVALLALALNTCEKDLISAAVEKSSEILATVFEEIRLELDHLKDVALLALAINTCEKNLISAAVKKSSEILATVFEEIHQLENLKSDISSEAGKTSNLANTKTQKFLATVFKELESLKSDISSEADFMCTTEGLEADRSEFKGSIKKQGTSHQKLIGQFEGYIETKMENATKRIDSV